MKHFTEPELEALKDSILENFEYYADALDNREYQCHGISGDPPTIGYIKKVCADYDADSKLVEDIRIYTQGDTMLSRDYYGKTVDITAKVEEFLRDDLGWDWLIGAVAKAVDEWIEEGEGDEQ